MKRLAFALLLAASLASVADARTLVVYRKPGNIDAVGPYVASKSDARVVEVVSQILDRVTGGQSDNTYGYRLVRSDLVNTESARSGLLVYGRGGPNPIGEQYDAVVWLNLGITNLGASVPRLDSMYIANSALAKEGGPRVPQLFLFSDGLQQWSGANTVSCAKCSLGVADNSNHSDVTSGYFHHRNGNVRGWYTAGLFNSYFIHASNREPRGGYRPLVLVNRSVYDNYPYNGVIPSWRDSIYGTYGASNDSVSMWELPGTGGASSTVLCYPDGNGGPKDSLLLANEGAASPTLLIDDHEAAEVDPALILMALARLDSLSGHRVFDPNKLPLRLGVTVDGAFMRTTHLPGPGIRPQDSTVVKATLDSIANLNAAGGVPIRMTVGVNVDSMTQTNYRSELAWWRKVAGTRFSPQPWRGVKTILTTTVGDGTANALAGSADGFPNIVDMLGFRRARFFKGDGAQFRDGAVNDDGDSSICALMEGARSRMVAAGIGPGEMSHTLLPALDDWSPASIAGSGRVASQKDMDSMLYVCRTCGGFSTVRSSNMSLQASAWRSGASAGTFRGVSNGTMGYQSIEGLYPDAAGVPVKILSHGGRSILGAYAALALIDSTAFTSDAFFDPLFDTIYSVWAGLTRTREHEQGDYRSQYASDFGAFAYDSIGFAGAAAIITPANYYGTVKNNFVDHSFMDSWPGSAHILALSMADLSGQVSGNREANPSRNGYWILKSLKDQFDAINDFAGKTVIQFDYPENISP